MNPVNESGHKAGRASLRASAEDRQRAELLARELQQLLEISSDLGNVGELSKFLEKFVVHATEFLGFARAFIALRENDVYSIRCVTEGEKACPLHYPLPSATVDWMVQRKDPFWSEDVTAIPGVDMELASMFSIRQLLSVPLLGSDGRPLGIFCVMDKVDGSEIHREDVRRANALSAQISVALEATQNLHLSNFHRRRAEDLVSTALELNASLRLPEFAQKFTVRAADTMEARAAVLVLSQRSLFEVAVFHDPAPAAPCDSGVARRLSRALAEWSARTPDIIAHGSACDLIGASLASTLGWNDLLLARMTGNGGELVGILGLADRGKELCAEDRNVLQALISHASVSLENSRLFTRMDQANRHWLEIFDSITDFIVVHDEANRVLRVNRSFADFIGVSPQELIGFSMRALALAPDADDQPCPFCRTGAESVDEYIHPVLERTYLVSTSLIHGTANEAFQTIHVLKDISDRREAERRYRELFDNIQEGLYFSSPEGRFIEVNEAMVRMLGYGSREELLRVDIPTQIYLEPKHHDRVCEELERTGVLHGFESTLQRKDGSLIHTLENAVAIRDAHGRVLQYRGMMMDVTELKNFQAELQRERDFSSKILNNTQSLILVVDTAGLISYANRRCYQSGNFKDVALLGRSLPDIVMARRRGAMLAAFATTLEGKQVDNLELPIMLASGRVARFSINLSPMRDEQGNINSVVVVMTDITDSSMLQAKLMHSDKMAAVGRLVSGVAHEVNNPLTAVLGFTDLLLSQDDIPEGSKENLRIILQEAQRTKQIVQNLLSFARQTPPKRQLVQINAVLRRTLALRAYDFSNRDIMLTEDLHETLPEIYGDEHQLQQVFLNIVNNAYDAVCEAGRKGEISVSTATMGGFAEIRFTDNGNGIRHPERVFDPFFTTKDIGKGTGLGLSICYGIVHEHGGDITCQNNIGPEASGATFTVRLPLKAAAAAKAGGVQ
jgi:two-component system NtrC family sensor kinase